MREFSANEVEGAHASSDDPHVAAGPSRLMARDERLVRSRSERRARETAPDAHDVPDDLPDRGLSFLEVLISLVLLGTVVTAVLFGLSTTIIGADRHRDLSIGSAALVDGLEYVKTRSFDTCANAPSSYDPPNMVRGDLTWSYSVSVRSSSDGTAYGACSNAHDLQLVTVTVSASDGNTTLSGDVAKRKG